MKIVKKAISTPDENGKPIKVVRDATPEEISKINELIEAEKQKRKNINNN